MKKKNNEELMNILEEFKPRIKKSLNSTSFQDREDLEQEINMKIIERLTTVKFEKLPSIWELLK